MSPTRFVHAAVCVGVVIWASQATAVGPELRCTELGSNCVCSEPMNVNDGAAVQVGWNPSDSVTKECHYSSGSETGFLGGAAGVSADRLNPKATSSLSYGGPAPPSYVIEMLEGYNNLRVQDIGTSEKRHCARWYERFGNQFICSVDDEFGPGCGLGPYGVGGKMFDSTDTAGGNTGNQLLIAATTASNQHCGGPGYCGPFRMDIDGDNVEGNLPSIGPDKCRADSSGNGGWCRIEQCIESTDGTTIRSPGNRRYTVRVTPLANPSAQETIATPSIHYNTGTNYWKFNNWNDQEGERARLEVSYYMDAGWNTAAGQWIGPAYEIEGGGSVVTPPSPTAPPAPVLLP